jgi:Resolvase, N terminal domain
VAEAGTVIRAAIYCRISRAFETMKGVERQLKDALAIGRAKGWTVTDESIYIDNNIGASEFSNKARTEYLRMLRDLEVGKYDAVILWLEDRGHRRVIDAWEFVQLCKTHGVTVYITSQDRNYDFTDPLERRRLYPGASDVNVSRLPKLESHIPAACDISGSRATGHEPYPMISSGMSGSASRRASPASSLVTACGASCGTGTSVTFPPRPEDSGPARRCGVY